MQARDGLDKALLDALRLKITCANQAQPVCVWLEQIGQLWHLPWALWMQWKAHPDTMHGWLWQSSRQSEPVEKSSPVAVSISQFWFQEMASLEQEHIVAAHDLGIAKHLSSSLGKEWPLGIVFPLNDPASELSGLIILPEKSQLDAEQRRHKLLSARVYLSALLQDALPPGSSIEQLGNAPHQLDRVARNLPGMVYQYCLHPDGQVTMPYVSEGCQTILGLSREAIQANPELMFSAIPTSARKTMDDSIAQSARDGTPWEWEGPFIHPATGEKRWFRAISCPTRLDDGSMVWDGVALDITEKKYISDKLFWSEERLRSALEFSEQGLWELNLVTGEAHYEGPKVSEFDFQSEGPRALLESEWRQAIYAEDLPQIEAAIQNYMQNSLPIFNVEFRVKTAQGDLRWMMARGKVSERDSEGKPTRLIGTTLDITDSKLIQTQLMESQEKAEQANQTKSQFLAIISHEIRTPMNGLLGMTGLLQETQLTPKQQEYLETIRYSGDLLMSIINDILDFSKIESGTLDVKPQLFELNKLLNTLLPPYRHQATQKGLQLITDVDPGVPNILFSDPIRLMQIIINLVSNAIKFTNQGAVTLAVRKVPLTQQPEADGVEFTVSDTGIGIPSEQQQVIFEAFYQVNSMNSRFHGGTGLGLSISTHLAKKLGSRIQVDSNEESGSRFWFVLDCIPADPVAITEPPARPTPTQYPQLNARILLVEDNPINQKIASQLLITMGATVTIAKHGMQALRMAQEQSFDLVLMDIQMPGMDGFTTAECWRKTVANDNAAIPIIALSANTGTDSEQQLAESGMQGYIEKPIDVRQLFETINRVLNSVSHR